MTGEIWGSNRCLFNIRRNIKLVGGARILSGSGLVTRVFFSSPLAKSPTKRDQYEYETGRESEQRAACWEDQKLHRDSTATTTSWWHYISRQGPLFIVDGSVVFILSPIDHTPLYFIILHLHICCVVFCVFQTLKNNSPQSYVLHIILLSYFLLCSGYFLFCML